MPKAPEAATPLNKYCTQSIARVNPADLKTLKSQMCILFKLISQCSQA